MKRSVGLLLVGAGVALCAVGCGADYASSGRNGGIGDGEPTGGAGGRGPDNWTSGGIDGGSGCTTQAQCIAGYTCQAGLCVPPETETDRSTGTPVATPRYVYALNPSAAQVARIDPLSLQIEAVTVGAQPVALAALPGEDAAVVLSYDDGSLTIVDSQTLPSRALRVGIKRQMSRLTVSQDGQFAVAWPDPAVPPSSGSEGVFTLINVAKARAGAPDAEVRFDRAGGYRITNVVFRTDNGVATKLYVFAKSSVSTFDLANASALPTRLTLPASMSADVSSREVISNEDGRIVMLRSTVTPELASFDGATLTLVPLPEIATDLDLLPDGSAAVAALRVAGEVAFIEIPADLAAPSGIQRFPVAGLSVGQVALPPRVPATGMFALVYSTVETDEAFAHVALPSGTVTRHALEKTVAEIAVSPDGRSALILHDPTVIPGVTDPYERAVDADEGYSVFDIPTGYWQLQRTGTTRPTRFAFSPKGGYVGIALRNDATAKHSLHAVNLNTLVPVALPLSSTPLFMGTVPEAPGITPHRVFVSQKHNAGRISVIQLDSGQVRTATGFTLNAEIE